MNKIFFTITGTCYRYGHEFIEPGMTVRIIKEPDNEFDKEAIKVEMEGLGLIGYVPTAPTPFRVRVTAPAVSTTRSGIPPRARLCMCCLRECWRMWKWKETVLCRRQETSHNMSKYRTSWLEFAIRLALFIWSSLNYSFFWLFSVSNLLKHG